MRPILFLLPLFACFFVAMGMVVSSTYPESGWIAPLLFGLGAGLIAMWGTLDFNGFKAVFARKGAKYGAGSGFVVLLGVAIIVGFAFVSSKPRFNKSFDVTRDRLNTLSDQSIKIINLTKKQDSPVQITGFFMGEEVGSKFRDLIFAYEANQLNADISYIDPQTEPALALSEKVNGNVVIFKYASREHRVSVFTEEKVTNALVNVMKEKTKKVYFTIGHGEGGVENKEGSGFALVTEELKSNKYEVAPLALLESATIPSDADLVVVAGPLYDYTASEVALIENYLVRGGSVLAMIDSLTPAANLNTMLEKFGVTVNTDILMLSPDDPRAAQIGQNNAIVSEFDEFSPISRDFASKSAVRIVMGFTRTLAEKSGNIRKMKVVMAAKSSKIMMKVKGVSSAADLKEVTEDRVEVGSFPVIAVASGKIAPATANNGHDSTKADTKSDVPNGSSSTSVKETRLVVAGSSHFANNAGAMYQENKDMFMNITSYLLQDEDFISIRPKDPTKSTISLTTLGSQILLLVLAFIYPFVILGGGTVNWLMRRAA